VRFVSAALFFLSASLAMHAQTYSSGQPVIPAYEGWEKNEDGSFSLVFGYMNENWQEEPTLPIGADNSFSPGPADQGQPTHFLPRRNRFIFRVRVPKDFGTKELVWTLTSHGETNKAFASLRPDLVLEPVDLMSETGALGAGTSSPAIRADKPPVLALDGPKTLTARVDYPVTLTATMTDDGMPKARIVPAPASVSAAMSRKPSRITVQKNLGLHLSWFLYRGPGRATFDPAQIKIWEDTRAGANSPWAPLWFPPPETPDHKYSVKVTFSEPGTYMICARADDGYLTTDEMVTITVAR
jgi:hypothetical protein